MEVQLQIFTFTLNVMNQQIHTGRERASCTYWVVPLQKWLSLRPIHLGFVVDKMHWLRFLLKYFSFPLSGSFHQWSMLIFIII
jgi:hypothetical protein